MLCKGDSIGVFQVESRAQINMLPRLKPRCLYDLTIQVAIVRPGPIQGDMVHPYLRRRAGREKPEFPSPHPDHGPPDELQQVLGKTLGVPLFQEQAMKLAMVAARFTDSEANQLRKAMATFRHNGGIDKFHDKMIGGMVARGYDPEFADRCYRQIQGFGSYGFPESHALSFARLVYISSWIKCHHPAVFAAALLNSQPMGFYAPAQIVRDAREHGVEVHAADVNGSGWDSGVGRSSPSLLGEGDHPKDGGGALAPYPSTPPLRVAVPLPEASSGRMRLHLGLRQIDSFRCEWADRILAARPFTSVEDLARRAGLPTRAMKLLADADALRSLGQDRREGGWDVRRLPSDELPLFAAARARELTEEPDMALPTMQLGEHVSADYQTIRLSLKAHPMEILRPAFAAEGIMSCADLAHAKAGARLRTAGIVLVRQRPGNGKAIFITIEDETGVANIIMWARTFEAYRRAVMASRLMEVHGEVQRSPEGVIHLMTHCVFDRSPLLATLSEAHNPNIVLSRADTFLNPLHPSQASRSGAKSPRHSHPRDVRTFPKSRDFH
jgi:error-prone DNA polymerase